MINLHIGIGKVKAFALILSFGVLEVRLKHINVKIHVLNGIGFFGLDILLYANK